MLFMVALWYPECVDPEKPSCSRDKAECKCSPELFSALYAGDPCSCLSGQSGVDFDGEEKGSRVRRISPYSLSHLF